MPRIGDSDVPGLTSEGDFEDQENDANDGWIWDAGVEDELNTWLEDHDTKLYNLASRRAAYLIDSYETKVMQQLRDALPQVETTLSNPGQFSNSILNTIRGHFYGTVSSDIPTLKTQVSDLLKSFDYICAEKATLQEKLDKCLEERDLARDCKAAESDKLQGILKEVEIVNSENVDLKTESNELRLKVDELERQNDNLARKTDELRRENTKIRDENDDLERNNVSLKSEDESLKGRKDELESENSGLKGENSNLRHENDNLRSKNNALKSEINAVRCEKNRAVSRKDCLIGENTTLEEEKIKAEWSQVRAGLELQIDQAKRQEADLKEELSSCRSETRQLYEQFGVQEGVMADQTALLLELKTECERLDNANSGLQRSARTSELSVIKLVGLVGRYSQVIQWVKDVESMRYGDHNDNGKRMAATESDHSIKA